MQNLKSKIIFIVVLVLCIFSFFAISKVAIIHNNDTDSIKFKEEYESLNGKLNEKDKLQVYLTYKIVIKNESSLYMSANEVSNYFDKPLD